jgi:hypothetical protein
MRSKHRINLILDPTVVSQTLDDFALRRNHFGAILIPLSSLMTSPLM